LNCASRLLHPPRRNGRNAPLRKGDHSAPDNVSININSIQFNSHTCKVLTFLDSRASLKHSEHSSLKILFSRHISLVREVSLGGLATKTALPQERGNVPSTGAGSSNSAKVLPTPLPCAVAPLTLASACAMNELHFTPTSSTTSSS
jgi:hypothetical protein